MNKQQQDMPKQDLEELIRHSSRSMSVGIHKWKKEPHFVVEVKREVVGVTPDDGPMEFWSSAGDPLKHVTDEEMNQMFSETYNATEEQISKEYDRFRKVIIEEMGNK